MSAMYFILLSCLICAGAMPATFDQRQDGETNLRADVKNIAVVAVIPSRETSAVMDILSAALSRRFQGHRKHLRAHQKAAPHHEDGDVDDFVFAESRSPYVVDISQAKNSVFADKRMDARYFPKYGHRFSKLEEADIDIPVPVVLQVKNNQYVAPIESESQTNREFDNMVESQISPVDNAPAEHFKTIKEDTKNAVAIDHESPPELHRDELKLIGAQEQCAPDQFRDSEGICQLMNS